MATPRIPLNSLLRGLPNTPLFLPPRTIGHSFSALSAVQHPSLETISAFDQSPTSNIFLFSMFSSRKSSIIVCSLWLATLVAVYYVGRRGGVGATPNESLTEAAPIAKDSVDRLESNSAPRQDARTLPRRRPTQNRPVSFDSITTESAPDLLVEAMESEDRPLRMAKLIQSAAAMSPENILAAIELVVDQPDGFARERELSLIVEAWVNFDGKGALEYFENVTDPRLRRWGMDFAVESWARSSPREAVKWSLEKAGGRSSPFFKEILRGIAESDLPYAIRLVSETKEPGARKTGLAIVLTDLIDRGAGSAIRWAEKLPPGEFRDEARTLLVDLLAHREPEVSAEWVLSLPDEDEKKRSVSRFAERWGRKDAEEASAWAAGIQNRELRSEAMAGVVRNWALHKPQDAGEWLNQFPPSEELDLPVSVYIEKVRKHDPESALSWAQSIIDDNIRRRWIGRITFEWKRSDPDGAQAWMEANGLAR